MSTCPGSWTILMQCGGLSSDGGRMGSDRIPSRHPFVVVGDEGHLVGRLGLVRTL